MYLSERIEADRITIQTDTLGGMSDDGMRHRWAVSLHRPGGSVFTLPDPFESTEEPTAFDVLDLVTGVCNLIDQARTWRDWQSEYMTAQPYTEEWDKRDEIYTETMYITWCSINDKLRDFLGDRAHQDYLYETDRSR